MLKHKLHILIFICILFLQVNFVFAQINNTIKLNATNYSQNDGLPDKIISFSFEDMNGYRWFGTFNGICKFDGYQFYPVRPVSIDSNGLFNGQFRSFIKWNDSIYYLGTSFDGLFKLNVFTHQLTYLSKTPSSSISLCKLDSNTLLIGSVNKGLFQYQIFENKTTKINVNQNPLRYKLEVSVINKIIPSKINNKYWLVTNMGLLHYDYKEKNCVTYYNEANNKAENYHALNHIKDLWVENDSIIWVSRFFGGLGKLNLYTQNWDDYFFDINNAHENIKNTNIIYQMVSISNHKLLCATNGGFMQFDTESNQFTVFSLTNNNYIPEPEILHISIDSKSNTWLCTPGSGVFLSTQNKNAAHLIEFPVQRYKGDFYKSTLMDIKYSDYYKTYFASISNHDGMISFDKNYNNIKTYDIPNSWKNEPMSVSIAIDNKNMIWLTDVANRLLYLPSINGKIKYESNKYFNYCYKMVQSNNKLFFITDSGLFERNNNAFIKLDKTIKTNLVSNLKNGYLYFIDSTSIKKFNTENSTISDCYTLDKKYVSNNNYLQDVFVDKKNRLWITLEYGGIVCIHLNTNKLRVYSYKDGLTINLSRVVKEDKNGVLFVQCSGGTYYLDEAQDRFVDLIHLKPKHIIEWYEGFIDFDENNNLLLSNNNQLYAFKSPVNSINFPVKIVEIIAGDVSYYATNNIINPGNGMNALTISFSNLNYPLSKTIVYEYMVDELGRNWTSLPPGVNSIALQLEEGKYHFRVRQKGTDNIAWCQINIQEKWFKSNLFYRSLVAISIFIIFSILTYYLWQKKREHKLNNLIAQYKLKALQLQLNPHFLFNSLTSINGLIKTKQFGKADVILQDFAMLMRKILLVSDEEWISLEEELKIASLYLNIERMRKDDIFIYEINNHDVNLSSILIPPLLLQPYLENSIKHGFGRKDENQIYSIKINLFQNEKGTTIVIEDNGKKLVKSNTIFNKHKSVGSKIQEQRTEIYNERFGKTYKIKSEILTPNGYKVTIDLG